VPITRATFYWRRDQHHSSRDQGADGARSSRRRTGAAAGRRAQDGDDHGFHACLGLGGPGRLVHSRSPTEWMPWNYREALGRLTGPPPKIARSIHPAASSPRRTRRQRRQQQLCRASATAASSPKRSLTSPPDRAGQGTRLPRGVESLRLGPRPASGPRRRRARRERRRGAAANAVALCLQSLPTQRGSPGCNVTIPARSLPSSERGPEAPAPRGYRDSGTGPGQGALPGIFHACGKDTLDQRSWNSWSRVIASGGHLARRVRRSSIRERGRWHGMCAISLSSAASAPRQPPRSGGEAVNAESIGKDPARIEPRFHGRWSNGKSAGPFMR
jgi:hypothetical protein